MEKKKIFQYAVLVLMLLFAVVLRVLFINTDLWYDEACSWYSAKQMFPAGILDNLLKLDLQHTPLYFFLLHFWMKIFGDSEVALRALSCIFGILSVPLSWVVASKLMEKKFALLLASIVAVSPALVFFSVEVRMYPLVVFLVLLSLNYFVDFEQKKDIKSLVKLTVVNILIPYSLVGGILYNFSLALCYGIYLFKSKTASFFTYLKAVLVELVALIPYFVLIFYYAKMRGLFVVKHEGSLAFFQIVEVIRNFFATNLVSNPYWPSVSAYEVTVGVTLFVVVPCIYFVYGLVQGFISSSKFLKTLYAVFFLNFVLALFFSALQVNVFTVRYILYLLIPLFILSIIGLSRKVSVKHLQIFAVFFVVSSIVFNIQYSKSSKILKTMAFNAVKLEAENLNLTSEDIVLMPFGSDAPYYFRKINTPRVFNFDFHKQIRNPYNDVYYDKEQQKLMDKEAKYSLVYDAIFADKCFSEAFINYFVSNVNTQVDKGRFVLLALYADDAASFVPITELRKSITSVQTIKDNLVNAMLQKYLYDVNYLLLFDFDLVASYKKDNYTYYLYKRK